MKRVAILIVFRCCQTKNKNKKKTNKSFNPSIYLLTNQRKEWKIRFLLSVVIKGVRLHRPAWSVLNGVQQGEGCDHPASNDKTRGHWPWWAWWSTADTLSILQRGNSCAQTKPEEWVWDHFEPREILPQQTIHTIATHPSIHKLTSCLYKPWALQVMVAEIVSTSLYLLMILCAILAWVGNRLDISLIISSQLTPFSTISTMTWYKKSANLRKSEAGWRI